MTLSIESRILTLHFLGLYVRKALQIMQLASRRVSFHDGGLGEFVGRGLVEDISCHDGPPFSRLVRAIQVSHGFKDEEDNRFY